MVSAIKQVVHDAKQDASKYRRQIDVNTVDAQFINDVLTSMNFKENSARELIMQVDTIRDVIQVTEGHNIRCFYALHAIFLALLSVDCTDVLNEMSDVDIRVLAKCISIAKERPCPDKVVLERALGSLQAKTRISSSSDEISNVAYINSNKIMEHVADLWDDAIAELNRWGNAIDNFERTVPTKKWLTLKELCDLLGFADINEYYARKKRLAVLHPEIDSWFKNHGKEGKLFDASHFQGLKQLFDEMKKNGRVPAGCWDIVQLADQMGLNDPTDTKKREHISQIKTTVKRKFPQVVDFFTPNCRYFRADCFEEWQKLRALAGQRGKYNVKKHADAEKPAKKAVAKFDPNKHYDKDQLAKVCGYKNGKILSTVVSTLKAKNDDFAKLVADCFIGVTKNKKYVVAFKKEKLSEFKAFLPYIVAENAKKSLDSDDVISMEELAKKLGWALSTLRSKLSNVLKNVTPERKAKINSWFVSSDIKKNYKSGLKIEFIDKVVKLFEGGRKYSKETTSFVRTPVKAIEKSAKVVKKAKKQKKQMVNAAEIKAALDKVLVKPGDSMVVVSEPEPVESKPMTLLDVVALEKILTAWNEMLAAATQERDAAEQNYKDVSAQVLTVKNAAERGDMLKQMMSANDAVLAAADNVREIQEKIDRANALKQERAEAARILAEKDALIAAFLKEASVNKK